MYGRKGERNKIINLLNESRFDAVCGLEGEGVPVFRILLGLSYDKTELVCWRAVEAVGYLSAAIAAGGKPGQVRNMVRRLVWTLSDECGGMAWTAPEMLAEMAVRNPVLLKDIPLIVVHLDEPPFRFGAAWAAGRLAETHREDARTARAQLEESLGHVDPFVRGAASWALGRLGATETVAALNKCREDQAEVFLYRDGDLYPTTVGRLAGEALNRLGA